MYKNWDNVRDYRIYGYLNQKEHDLLEQAIQITGKQKAVCVREMIVAQSEIIINKHNHGEKSTANGQETNNTSMTQLNISTSNKPTQMISTHLPKQK